MDHIWAWNQLSINTDLSSFFYVYSEYLRTDPGSQWIKYPVGIWSELKSLVIVTYWEQNLPEWWVEGWGAAPVMGQLFTSLLLPWFQPPPPRPPLPLFLLLFLFLIFLLFLFLPPLPTYTSASSSYSSSSSSSPILPHHLPPCHLYSIPPLYLLPPPHPHCLSRVAMGQPEKAVY